MADDDDLLTFPSFSTVIAPCAAAVREKRKESMEEINPISRSRSPSTTETSVEDRFEISLLGRAVAVAVAVATVEVERATKELTAVSSEVFKAGVEAEALAKSALRASAWLAESGPPLLEAFPFLFFFSGVEEAEAKERSKRGGGGGGGGGEVEEECAKGKNAKKPLRASKDLKKSFFIAMFLKQLRA